MEAVVWWVGAVSSAGSEPFDDLSLQTKRFELKDTGLIMSRLDLKKRRYLAARDAKIAAFKIQVSMVD